MRLPGQKIYSNLAPTLLRQPFVEECTCSCSGGFHFQFVYAGCLVKYTHVGHNFCTHAFGDAEIMHFIVDFLFVHYFGKIFNISRFMLPHNKESNTVTNFLQWFFQRLCNISNFWVKIDIAKKWGSLTITQCWQIPPLTLVHFFVLALTNYSIAQSVHSWYITISYYFPWT